MATLESLKKAILFKNQDLSKVMMPKVIAQLNAYMTTHSATACVEEGALMFYLLNDAFGKLSMSVDSKATLTDYQEKLALSYLNSASESSARLWYYMLLITTREARHVHGSDSFFAKLETKYGSDMTEYCKHLKGKNSNTAVSYFQSAQKYLKNVTLGTYTSCITDVFNTGSFSGGYGGKPWGNIADTLRKHVHGETSIEIMNDTAWTLAHNNGPMFNKGMLYKGFSTTIYKILDVQRAGMIPQLVASGDLSTSYVTPAVKEAMSIYTLVFPEVFQDTYVDWVKVEALGSLHKYPNEKKAQIQKYGKSSMSLNATDEDSKIWVNNYEYAVKKQYKRAA